MSSRDELEKLRRFRIDSIRQQLDNPTQEQQSIIDTGRGIVEKTWSDHITKQREQTRQNTWDSAITLSIDDPSTMEAYIWNNYSGKERDDAYKQLDYSYNTPGTKYYDPYHKKVTNQKYLDNLTALGVQVPKVVTSDWLNEMSQQYRGDFKYSDTSGNPGKPTGKKVTANQQIAYNIWQLQQDEDTTEKAEAEWADYKQKVTYWAQKGLSDKEIEAKIDMKKYPTLSKMDESRTAGNYVPMNRVLGYSKDAVKGVMWKARNGYGDDMDDFQAAVRSKLGQGRGDRSTAKQIAQRTVGTSEYNPYIGGSNDDDARMTMGVKSWDNEWLKAHQQDMFAAGQKDLWIQMDKELGNYEAAKKQYDILDKWVSGYNYDFDAENIRAVVDKLSADLDDRLNNTSGLYMDEIDGAGKLKSLTDMDEGRRTGKPVGLSDELNYRKEDVLAEMVQRYFLQNGQKITGEQAAYAVSHADEMDKAAEKASKTETDSWNRVKGADGMGLEDMTAYANGFLTKGSKVDLGNRPVLDSQALIDAGWDEEPGSRVTLYSITEGLGDRQHQMNALLTPVLADGKVLTPEEFDKYVDELSKYTTPEDVIKHDRLGVVMVVNPGKWDDYADIDALGQSLHSLSDGIEGLKTAGGVYSANSAAEEYGQSVEAPAPETTPAPVTDPVEQVLHAPETETSDEWEDQYGQRVEDYTTSHPSNGTFNNNFMVPIMNTEGAQSGSLRYSPRLADGAMSTEGKKLPEQSYLNVKNGKVYTRSQLETALTNMFMGVELNEEETAAASMLVKTIPWAFRTKKKVAAPMSAWSTFENNGQPIFDALDASESGYATAKDQAQMALAFYDDAARAAASGFNIATYYKEHPEEYTDIQSIINKIYNRRDTQLAEAAQKAEEDKTNRLATGKAIIGKLGSDRGLTADEQTFLQGILPTGDPQERDTYLGRKSVNNEYLKSIDYDTKLSDAQDAWYEAQRATGTEINVDQFALDSKLDGITELMEQSIIFDAKLAESAGMTLEEYYQKTGSLNLEDRFRQAQEQWEAREAPENRTDEQNLGIGLYGVWAGLKMGSIDTAAGYVGFAADIAGMNNTDQHKGIKESWLEYTFGNDVSSVVEARSSYRSAVLAYADSLNESDPQRADALRSMMYEATANGEDIFNVPFDIDLDKLERAYESLQKINQVEQEYIDTHATNFEKAAVRQWRSAVSSLERMGISTALSFAGAPGAVAGAVAFFPGTYDSTYRAEVASNGGDKTSAAVYAGISAMIDTFTEQAFLSKWYNFGGEAAQSWLLNMQKAQLAKIGPAGTAGNLAHRAAAYFLGWAATASAETLQELGQDGISTVWDFVYHGRDVDWLKDQFDFINNPEARQNLVDTIASTLMSVTFSYNGQQIFGRGNITRNGDGATAFSSYNVLQRNRLVGEQMRKLDAQRKVDEQTLAEDTSDMTVDLGEEETTTPEVPALVAEAQQPEAPAAPAPVAPQEQQSPAGQDTDVFGDPVNGTSTDLNAPHVQEAPVTEAPATQEPDIVFPETNPNERYKQTEMKGLGRRKWGVRSTQEAPVEMNDESVSPGQISMDEYAATQEKLRQMASAPPPGFSPNEQYEQLEMDGLGRRRRVKPTQPAAEFEADESVSPGQISMDEYAADQEKTRLETTTVPNFNEAVDNGRYEQTGMFPGYKGPSVSSDEGSDTTGAATPGVSGQINMEESMGLQAEERYNRAVDTGEKAVEQAYVSTEGQKEKHLESILKSAVEKYNVARAKWSAKLNALENEAKQAEEDYQSQRAALQRDEYYAQREVDRCNELRKEISTELFNLREKHAEEKAAAEKRREEKKKAAWDRYRELQEMGYKPHKPNFSEPDITPSNGPTLNERAEAEVKRRLERARENYDKAVEELKAVQEKQTAARHEVSEKKKAFWDLQETANKALEPLRDVMGKASDALNAFKEQVHDTLDFQREADSKIRDMRFAVDDRVNILGNLGYLVEEIGEGIANFADETFPYQRNLFKKAIDLVKEGAAQGFGQGLEISDDILNETNSQTLVSAVEAVVDELTGQLGAMTIRANDILRDAALKVSLYTLYSTPELREEAIKNMTEQYTSEAITAGRLTEDADAKNAVKATEDAKNELDAATEEQNQAEAALQTAQQNLDSVTANRGQEGWSPKQEIAAAKGVDTAKKNAETSRKKAKNSKEKYDRAKENSDAVLDAKRESLEAEAKDVATVKFDQEAAEFTTNVNHIDEPIVPDTPAPNAEPTTTIRTNEENAALAQDANAEASRLDSLTPEQEAAETQQNTEGLAKAEEEENDENLPMQGPKLPITTTFGNRLRSEAVNEKGKQILTKAQTDSIEKAIIGDNDMADFYNDLSAEDLLRFVNDFKGKTRSRTASFMRNWMETELQQKAAAESGIDKADVIKKLKSEVRKAIKAKDYSIVEKAMEKYIEGHEDLFDIALDADGIYIDGENISFNGAFSEDMSNGVGDAPADTDTPDINDQMESLLPEQEEPEGEPMELPDEEEAPVAEQPAAEQPAAEQPAEDKKNKPRLWQISSNDPDTGNSTYYAYMSENQMREYERMWYKSKGLDRNKEKKHFFTVSYATAQEESATAEEREQLIANSYKWDEDYMRSMWNAFGGPETDYYKSQWNAPTAEAPAAEAEAPAVEAEAPVEEKPKRKRTPRKPKPVIAEEVSMESTSESLTQSLSDDLKASIGGDKLAQAIIKQINDAQNVYNKAQAEVMDDTKKVDVTALTQTMDEAKEKIQQMTESFNRRVGMLQRKVQAEQRAEARKSVDRSEARQAEVNTLLEGVAKRVEKILDKAKNSKAKNPKPMNYKDARDLVADLRSILDVGLATMENDIGANEIGKLAETVKTFTPAFDAVNELSELTGEEAAPGSIKSLNAAFIRAGKALVAAQANRNASDEGKQTFLNARTALTAARNKLMAYAHDMDARLVQMTPVESRAYADLSRPGRRTDITAGPETQARQSPIKTFQRLANDLRIGHYDVDRKTIPRRALGVYHPFSDAIGIGRNHANDAYVTMHEIGHAIEERTNFHGDTAMISAADPALMSQYSAADQPHEAVAEFVRTYMMDRQSAISVYGQATVDRFETECKANNIWKEVSRAALDIHDYTMANTGSQVDVSISKYQHKDQPQGIDRILHEGFRNTIMAQVDDTYGARDFDLAARAGADSDTLTVRQHLRLMKFSQRQGRGIITGMYFTPDNVATMPGMAETIEKDLTTGERLLHGDEDHDLLSRLMVLLQAKTRYDNAVSDAKASLPPTATPAEIADAVKKATDKTTVFGDRISIQEINDEITEIVNNHPNVAKSQRQLENLWHTFMRDWMPVAGISSETVEDLIKKYPHYCPLQRDMPNGKNGKNTRGGSSSTWAYGFKSIKGSDLDIIDPLVTMQSVITKTVEAARKNEALGEIVRALNTSPNLGAHAHIVTGDTEMVGIRAATLQEALDAAAAKAIAAGQSVDISQVGTLGAFLDDFTQYNKLNYTTDPDVLAYQNDGKVTLIKFDDPGLMDAVVQGYPEVGWYAQKLGKLTRNMSLLTTGMNVLFTAKNLVRDYQQGTVWGSWNSNVLSPLGLAKWVAAAIEVASNGKIKPGAAMAKVVNTLTLGTAKTSAVGSYADYKALGGDGYGGINIPTDEKTANELMRNLYGMYGMNAAEKAGHGLYKGTIGMIDKLNGVIEQTTRYVEYRYGKHDLSTPEGRAKAFLAAQDATVDFARRGNSKMAAACRAIIPFYNASLQGTWQVFDAVLDKDQRDRLAPRAAKLAINNMLLGAIGYMLLQNIGSDEDKEWYEKLPLGIRLDNIVLPFKDSNSKARQFIRIPVAQNWASRAFYAAGQLLARGNNGDEDGMDILAIAGNIVNNCVQTDFIFGPELAVLMNRSWAGGVIMSERLRTSSKRESEKYNQTTPEIFKIISRGLSQAGMEISPVYIQYLAQQHSGILGQVLIPALSPDSLDNYNLNPVGQVMRTIRNSWTIDPAYTNDINDAYYDGKAVLEGIVEGAKDNGASDYLSTNLTEEQAQDAVDTAAQLTGTYGALTEIQAQISNLTKAQKAILTNPNLSAEQKEAQRRNIQRDVVRLEEKGVGIVNDFYETYCTGTNPINHILFGGPVVGKAISIANKPKVFLDDYRAGEEYITNAVNFYSEQEAALEGTGKTPSSTILPSPSTSVSYQKNNLRVKSYAEDDGTPIWESYVGWYHDAYVKAYDSATKQQDWDKLSDEQKQTILSKCNSNANKIAAHEFLNWYKSKQR